MPKTLPRVIFLVVFGGITCGAFGTAGYAQGLPPTNYGKFVHQPGDNQYTNDTQNQRHGAPMPTAAPLAAPRAGSTLANAAYVPTPPPVQPDISVMPIVADEPIKSAGFPPLPDRLDLPVTTAWARSNAGAAAAGSNESDIPTMNRKYDRRPQGVHEHYVHYQAGACIPPEEQQAPAHGYYKVTTPAADYYSVNTGAKKPQEHEPQLNSRLDAPKQPDAPIAVTVNQSTTQDLSLPDDDFAYHPPTTKNTFGKQMARTMGRTVQSTIMNAASQATSVGSSALRYR